MAGTNQDPAAPGEMVPEPAPPGEEGAPDLRFRGTNAPVSVRARRPEDLPACVDALWQVHLADHYPIEWFDDPAAWLDPPGLVAAWVAEHAGVVVGHVGLTAGVDEPLRHEPRLPDGALPAGDLASVSRLYGAPGGRGRGLAVDLLAVVSEEARRRGWPLILDVVDGSGPAIGLYERLGWRLVGSRPATWTITGGLRPIVRVYAAP